MLNKPSWKIIIFSPVNQWRAIIFGNHTTYPMWALLKRIIYNLLWLAEYQCKGVVKFNLSDLFSGVSFGDYENGWIGKIYF